MSSEREIKMRKILREAKTIAVVGLSAKPHRAGYYVPAYLQDQGYRIIPVNPYLKTDTLGEKVYADLESLSEPVDLVLFFRRGEEIPPIIPFALKTGAKAVWLQLGIFSEDAKKMTEDAGLDFIQNACMLVEHRRLM